MKTERIFADTNLFLRYLTNDIPKQAEAIEKLLQRGINGEVILVTNSPVIAEMVWTLDSYYHLPPADIQAKIFAILNTPGLEVADGNVVLQAIMWYVEKNVDFIDAFNIAWMTDEGIGTACTFDTRHFSRFDGISVITPS